MSVMRCYEDYEREVCPGYWVRPAVRDGTVTTFGAEDASVFVERNRFFCSGFLAAVYAKPAARAPSAVTFKPLDMEDSGRRKFGPQQRDARADEEAKSRRQSAFATGATTTPAPKSRGSGDRRSFAGKTAGRSFLIRIVLSRRVG